MIIRKLISLAAVSVVLTATPALATQPESNARTVRYGDLDLLTPVGVKTLRHRIAAAMEAVCGSYEGAESGAMADQGRDIAKCRATARAQADLRLAAILSAPLVVASAR